LKQWFKRTSYWVLWAYEVGQTSLEVVRRGSGAYEISYEDRLTLLYGEKLEEMRVMAQRPIAP
jgi:hypothetical protein